MSKNGLEKGTETGRNTKGQFAPGSGGGPGRGHVKEDSTGTPEELFATIKKSLKVDLRSKTDSTRLKAATLLLKLQQIQAAWDEQEARKGKASLSEEMMKALVDGMGAKMTDDAVEVDEDEIDKKE